MDALYQGTAVRVRSSSIHKDTESSLKEQNMHRSCACNAVHETPQTSQFDTIPMGGFTAGAIRPPLRIL